MMAKIVKGGDFKGVVDYILDKDKGTQVVAYDGLFMENKETIAMSFNAQSRMNGKVTKPVGHIALSFSKEDEPRLTNRVMAGIALEYMKKMDDDKFYEMALPYLKEVITRDLDFHKIAAMVKTRIEVFPDIKDQVDFFEKVPEYETSMYVHKKMKTNEETSLQVLREVQPLLEAQEDFSNDALFEMLSAYAKEHGYKVGYVMWPIRTALSGKQMTPAGATEILEVLGKEESLVRIQAAIDKLN